MSQKDLFPEGHDSSSLKRGCQPSDAELQPCPCGSKKPFSKCHAADCECGSGKPKYKCCHTDDF